MGKRYWLYKYYIGNKLVYIGQTKQSLIRRYQAHCAEDSKYEKVDFVEISEVNNSAELNIAEIAMIAELKPPWNKKWVDMDIGFRVDTDAIKFKRIPIDELNTAEEKGSGKKRSIIVPTKPLTKKELDVFETLCQYLYHKGIKEVPIRWIKDSSNCEQYNATKFNRITDNVVKALFSLCEFDGYTIEPITLFSDIRIEQGKVCIEYGCDEALFYSHFKRMIVDNYDWYLDLPNAYAKSLYRLCSLRKCVGHIVIDADKFRFVMGIPSGYKANAIDKNVINPATKALETMFENMRCKKVYGKRKHGGGTRITAYEFTFEEPKKNKEQSAYDRFIGCAVELGIPEEAAQALYLNGIIGEENLLSYMQDKSAGVPF